MHVLPTFESPNTNNLYVAAKSRAIFQLRSKQIVSYLIFIQIYRGREDIIAIAVYVYYYIWFYTMFDVQSYEKKSYVKRCTYISS